MRDHVTTLEVEVRASHNLVKRLDAELMGAVQKRRELLSKHKAAWLELLSRELVGRGLNWCSKCGEVYEIYPEQFVFITGTKEYGDCESGYGTRAFSQLHHACPNCRQIFFDEHGTRGIETEFYAFQAAMSDEGFRIRKFGQWMSLEPKRASLRPLENLYEKDLHKLAAVCEMPPLLALPYSHSYLSKEKDLQVIDFDRALVPIPQA